LVIASLVAINPTLTLADERVAFKGAGEHMLTRRLAALGPRGGREELCALHAGEDGFMLSTLDMMPRWRNRVRSLLAWLPRALQQPLKPKAEGEAAVKANI
jgi:hypothetical protein